MLFESLMNRALGQKYARQDIDPTAPDRTMSGRVFFSKFPNLRQYLLDQLRDDVARLSAIGMNYSVADNPMQEIINSGLYPILTLVSRLDSLQLYPSIHDYNGLDEFLPLIEECMRSRVHKIRSMSARCLPSVLAQNVVAYKVTEIFEDMSFRAQNKLHGQLMAIKNLGQFYTNRTAKDEVFRTHWHLSLLI
jgi:hypothetical protein